jgi:hypothetical protein
MSTMDRGWVRGHEWPLLLLAIGGGVLWAVVSLLLGFSWFFIQARGVLRAVLTLMVLPLDVANWLGSTMQLSVTDPLGVVVATGVIMGSAVGGVCLAVLRWRGR